MPLPEEYQHTHDIDWFCVINNKHTHLASNGGIMPKIVNDEELLGKIQQDVAQMPVRYKYNLNRKYLDEILNDGRLRHIENLEEEILDLLIPISIDFGEYRLSPKEMVYCWSFIEMAQKGFYSYDRTEDGYHLIAEPTELLDSTKPAEFPPNIPTLEENVAQSENVILIH